MSKVVFSFEGQEVQYIKEFIYERVPDSDYPKLWRQSTKRVGLMVSFIHPVDNIIYVGWSRCAPRDKFDKVLAHKIALGRASLGSSSNQVPFEVELVIERFITRSRAYFKDKPVVVAGRFAEEEDPFVTATEM